jgi:hypothetical protein
MDKIQRRNQLYALSTALRASAMFRLVETDRPRSSSLIADLNLAGLGALGALWISGDFVKVSFHAAARRSEDCLSKQRSGPTHFREGRVRNEGWRGRRSRPRDHIAGLVFQLPLAGRAECLKSRQRRSRPLNLGSMRCLGERNDEAASSALNCPVVMNGLEKNFGWHHFGARGAATTGQVHLRARRRTFWSPVERTAFRAGNDFNKRRCPRADVVFLHRLLV